MFKKSIYGEWFCGNKISDYGLEHGRVDYSTFAKGFNAVLCNNIMESTEGMCGYWEQVNGIVDNGEYIEEIEEQLEELEEQIDEQEESLSDLDDEENEAQIANIEKTLEELRKQYAELEHDRDQLEEEEAESYRRECFQFYIVDDNGAELIKDFTNEVLYYNEDLDIYVWGVDHLGTAWTHVLTEIPCNVGLDKVMEEIGQ